MLGVNWRSSCVVRCLLFVVCYVLFDDRCSLFDCCCMFVLLLRTCCLLFVVMGSSLFVVCCSLIGLRCLFFTMWLLDVVCCSLTCVDVCVCL